MKEASLPRLFVAAGSKRWLWTLAAVTLLSGAAMLPEMQTMADHGASLIAFESAGSVLRSHEIVTGWGEGGETAAWWQLALDTPFLIGYGLFLAGASAAVASRARGAGKPRLERVAAAIAWFGPLAAGADLLQNFSLALILSGHETQPWPRISAIGGKVSMGLTIVAVVFALVGVLVTRRQATFEPARPREAE